MVADMCPQPSNILEENVRRHRFWKIVGGVFIAIAVVVLVWNVGLHVYEIDEPITAEPSDCRGDLRFAVIGDFGDTGQAEADVAALVDSWEVDLVVTTGDNNYPDGQASTIDANIGQYYSDYISPYQGEYGPGGTENRFYPALGNHDWRTESLQPYLDYFTLPGNERYYDFERGPVHFFILDSDPHEPDGRRRESIQAGWLEKQLETTQASWKLVFLHNPPYTSSLRQGSDHEIQWPYARWGADAVIAGHNHLYERLQRDGITYIVNGLGGRWRSINPIHRFLFPTPGSRVRYNLNYGAQLVTADETCINFSFYSHRGDLIDSYTLLNDVY
jgi:tartrate-resistant acid phosphatase type 5